MGMELGAETSENLHILTRMTARENFTEFCRRGSSKTYNVYTMYRQNAEFLGALAKFRKATIASSCLSVCQQAATQLPTDGFS